MLRLLKVWWAWRRDRPNPADYVTHTSPDGIPHQDYDSVRFYSDLRVWRSLGPLEWNRFSRYRTERK